MTLFRVIAISSIARKKTAAKHKN